MQASEFMLRTFESDRSDPGNVVRNSINPELVQLKAALSAFQQDYGTRLPGNAPGILNEFLRKWDVQESVKTGFELVALRKIVPLGVFRAAFQYAADDAEAQARNLTELAFEHLKRLLVVDTGAQERWKNAFGNGETRCEALGAVHLLGHGIWAFKVSAAGAATDLILPEPVVDHASTIERTARALVLTEWKVVRELQELERKAAEARTQAKLYTGGVLAGVELRSVRYIVLVSLDDMEQPADLVEGRITYRHLVIPIESKTPSRQARRTGAA